jgi:ABC-type Fe3+ transport system permease subunit
MAMVFFLLASIGGVAVADLALENPTASEATVFTQPISGSSQGVLLAMAAALGSVVAGLLVAWMSSTSAWPARRTQLRTVSVGTQSQAAAPAREQAGLLEEWFGRHVPVGDLGQPVR